MRNDRRRWLRRRGWVLPVAIIGCAALAYGLTSQRTQTYTAESDTIVNSGATGGGPGSAQDAVQLAATLGGVLQTDDALIQALAGQEHVTPSVARDRLRVTNRVGTAILAVSYRAPTAGAAINGAQDAAKLLTAPSPSAAAIKPGTLNLTHLPNKASTSSLSPSVAAAVAGLLGLLLGAICIVAWERTDARIESLDAAESVFGCPASRLRDLDPSFARALMRRWVDKAREHRPAASFAVRPTIAVVGLDEPGESAAARLVERMRAAGSSDAPAWSDQPTYAAGSLILADSRTPQLAAQEADTVVVVVAPGSRLASAHRLHSELCDFGRSPAWVLLGEADDADGLHATRPRHETTSDGAVPARPATQPHLT